MYLKILAFDLDGTLTENEHLSPDTLAMLRQAKEKGYSLILVTGRRLKTIPDIAAFEDLCEAIVAENGAALFFPRNHTVSLPFGQISHEVKNKLIAMDLPIELGMAIAATWTPHDKSVLQVLSETGYAATLEYNKGAVMILPPGATKGTGLRVALHELGFSSHNVIAFGDAENDRSLFEQVELSVAVGGATKEIKKIADVVLIEPNGSGINMFLRDLFLGKLAAHRTKPKLKLALGNKKGRPFFLDPITLLNGNLGITGSSRSGKSWVAGFLVEQLLRAEYQVCLIDPEGDYRGIRAFPQTILLGGSEVMPLPVEDVITLIEYSNLSLIVDLSQYTLEQKSHYVGDLLRAIYSMKKEKGVPHWVLIDEAQYFCSLEESELTRLIIDQLNEGGLGVISYQPSRLASEILEKINHWMITRMINPEETTLLSNRLGKGIEWEMLSNLINGQAYLYIKNGPDQQMGIVEFGDAQRVIPHVRHLHKYLRAPLPAAKRFYFKINGAPKSAASLWEFSQTIALLPVETIEYHLSNKDFQRWVRDTLNDRELARRIKKLSRREIHGEELRNELSVLVKERFEELDSLI